MKVTLIYPLLSKNRSRIDENKQYWPPLGLAYIAAVLEENNHTVGILDRDYILRKNGFDFDRADEVTLGLIDDFKPEVVGFSATSANISDVNLFSKKIKKDNPGVTTVIGGPHCIAEPVATLELCGCIDLLARGEGEMTMLDIASAIAPDKILGLTYRKKDGGIISNEDRPLIESLDALPLPARHLLDMGYYTRPSRFISRNLSLKTTQIFSARGCPYNCHYCAGPLMGRRRLRYHSVERVIFEIKELINKYSIEAVYFAEDMFLSDKKRALELTDSLIQNGLHKKVAWMAQVSPNAVDDELLSKMKQAGCVHVEYGFESGSQRMLELMNKKTNVERNKKVSFMTRRNKLRFQGNFIVGYPGEREEDFKKTLSFIKKARPNNVSLNLFMPLPGTQIYNRLKKENRPLPNWDDLGNPEMPSINYADMPPGRFEQLYFKAKLVLVLPMNLLNFLKDNLKHPFRIIYVISTQFRSVIRRALQAFVELRRINKKAKGGQNILFITYHSICSPLMQSQGLSYIESLLKKGVNYSLLTFETRDSLLAAAGSSSVPEISYDWRYLFYHRKPRALAKAWDILCGMIKAVFIIKKNKINVVHARGLVAAVIGFAPARICGARFFFDTRGLLADKYVGGALLKKDGPLYKLMRWLEDFLVERSDYFTVETHKHAETFRETKAKLSAKMEVIPCCVNMGEFNYRLYPRSSGNGFRLVYLGKTGTWYLIVEMLEFFKVLCAKIRDCEFVFITQDEPGYIYSAAQAKAIARPKITVIKPRREEIPALLAGSDAGIFFINSYKRYNSSPIKFGEYLASGLPVVINAGIGDTETITEREGIGVVVNNFSEECYRDAVSRLSGLLNEKEDLRLRCRQAAQKYLSLEEGSERYLRIYRRLS